MKRLHLTLTMLLLAPLATLHAATLAAVVVVIIRLQGVAFAAGLVRWERLVERAAS